MREDLSHDTPRAADRADGPAVHGSPARSSDASTASTANDDVDTNAPATYACAERPALTDY